MTHRLRLILTIIVALLLLLVAAVVIAVHVLLKPERFTAMLEDMAAQSGLVLHTDGPVQTQWWPHLGVRVHGLSLTAAGASTSTPLLTAREVHLAASWRSLLGGNVALSRLQLVAPRLDTTQMSALVDALSAKASAGPPQWPTVKVGIRVQHGQLLRGNQLLLGDVDLSTGHLIVGQPFNLDLSGRSSAGRPIAVHGTAVPLQGGDGLRLAPVQLRIVSGDVHAELAGKVAWHGGEQVGGQLRGTVDRGAEHYTVDLRALPAAGSAGMRLQASVDGEQVHIATKLQPAHLAHWWANVVAGASIALPPVAAHVEAANFDLGQLHIKGLRIDSGASPANAASVPVPAASARAAAASSAAASRK